MFQFSANLYRIAFSCVSKETTRYYLGGVLVEPAKFGRPGVTMTSTDGHRLIHVYDETGKATESKIIRLSDFALKACKGLNVVRIESNSQVARVHEMPKYWSEVPEVLTALPVVAQCGTDPVVIGEREGEYGMEPVYSSSSDSCFIDGTFPDYCRVIPSMPSRPEMWGGGFNGSLIADFGKAACELTKHFDKGKQGIFRILSPEAGGPALIQFPNTPQAFGVLMPMRCETSECLPDWYCQPLPASNVVMIPDMREAA